MFVLTHRADDVPQHDQPCFATATMFSTYVSQMCSNGFGKNDCFRYIQVSSDMQTVALQRPHAVGTTDCLIKRNSFLELLLDK
jgi:hypothetical protein